MVPPAAPQLLVALALLSSSAIARSAGDDRLSTNMVVPDIFQKIRPDNQLNKQLRSRELQDLSGLSPLCSLSFSIISVWQELLASLVPQNPGFTFDNSTGALILDFASNKTSFDLYDTTCNQVAGGQTLSLSIDSDGTGCVFPNDIVNYPSCMGSTAFCNEADVNIYVTFIESSLSLDPDSCSVDITHESDGYGGEEFPDVPEDCFLTMASMFFYIGLYDDYVPDIVNYDGMFSGNIEAYEKFESECYVSDGRIVTINYDLPDSCGVPDYVLVPACVSNSCTNDEGILASSFLRDLVADEECKGAVAQFVADGFDTPDDEGDDDDEGDQFIPGVSIICQLSSGFLDGSDEVLVTPDPGLIYEDPSNPASLIAVDFGSNKTAFDQYDTTCNGFGGQTLKINATQDGTACALKYDYWNLPICFGPAGVCTEADVENFAAYIFSFIEDGNDNGCSLFLDSVESDGFGADVQAPNVADSCSNEMIFLFTGSGVYNDYDSVVDETSGMLTGNTTASENFNKACADNSGKVVTANADYPDACDSSDFSEVPACVGMSCTNNDAASFLSFLLGLDCQGTTIEIVADDPSNDTSSSGSTSVALTGTVFMAITGWILQLFF